MTNTKVGADVESPFSVDRRAESRKLVEMAFASEREAVGSLIGTAVRFGIIGLSFRQRGQEMTADISAHWPREFIAALKDASLGQGSSEASMSEIEQRHGRGALAWLVLGAHLNGSTARVCWSATNHERQYWNERLRFFSGRWLWNDTCRDPQGIPTYASQFMPGYWAWPNLSDDKSYGFVVCDEVVVRRVSMPSRSRAGVNILARVLGGDQIGFSEPAIRTTALETTVTEVRKQIAEGACEQVAALGAWLMEVSIAASDLQSIVGLSVFRMSDGRRLDWSKVIAASRIGPLPVVDEAVGYRGAQPVLVVGASERRLLSRFNIATRTFQVRARFDIGLQLRHLWDRVTGLGERFSYRRVLGSEELAPAETFALACLQAETTQGHWLMPGVSRAVSQSLTLQLVGGRAAIRVDSEGNLVSLGRRHPAFLALVSGLRERPELVYPALTALAGGYDGWRVERRRWLRPRPMVATTSDG